MDKRNFRNSRLFDINWQRFPTVVFESDDWGACERAVSLKEAGQIEKIFSEYLNKKKDIIATLETPHELNRLFTVLDKYKGADGNPAVFTAFVCTSNPDFEAIKNSAFLEYKDIGLDEGVPPKWERGDIASEMRKGYERGVFAPEFHSGLHHTSPAIWLQLLNEESSRGEVARALFGLHCYAQDSHVPEYDGFHVKDQYAMVKKGIDRFKNIFGFLPHAAVSSDAYPETEIIWSICGIKTICLKNARNHTGETVVYNTKPWNFQDVYAAIGEYNQMNDVIYFTRNAFFESGMTSTENSAEEILEATRRTRKDFNEPSIISTHRINYISLNKELVEKRFAELELLLQKLSSEDKVNFLTTQEVSDLYRQGWSARKIGSNTIFKKWAENTSAITIEDPFTKIINLSKGKTLEHKDLSKLPLGSYLIV